MFSRLKKQDSLTDPIDALIADAELRLHEVEFGTEEYNQITKRIIELRKARTLYQSDSNQARLAMLGEVFGGLMFLLFAWKPELAQKYSKLYWEWRWARLFGFWR